MTSAVNIFFNCKKTEEMLKKSIKGLKLSFKIAYKKSLTTNIILVFLMIAPIVVKAQQQANCRTSGNWNSDATWTLTQSGTISTSFLSKTVTGTGTSFTSALVGKVITTNTDVVIGTVSSVSSSTSLTLSSGTLIVKTNAAFAVRKVPGAGDNVNIKAGYSITVTANASCLGLTLNKDQSDYYGAEITINSGDSLRVTNAVVANLSQDDLSDDNLNIDGYLSCGSLSLNADNAGTGGGCGGGGSSDAIYCNISSTGYVLVNGDLDFGTNYPENAVFDFSGSGTLNVAGHFADDCTIYNYTYSPGSTIICSGTGTKHLGSYTFQNLIINKPGGIVQPTGAITVNRNLTITAGCLSDSGFQIYGNSSGIFSIASGAGIRIGKGNTTSSTFPTGFTAAHMSLDANSNVYECNARTGVSNDPTYGNLYFSTTSVSTITKSVIGNLNIAGQLYIGNKITLNNASNRSHTLTDVIIDNGGTFTGGTACTHTIRGNFTNNGTFTKGTCKIKMACATASKSMNCASSWDFYDLEIAGSNTYPCQMSKDISCSGTLTLRSHLSIGAHTCTIKGALRHTYGSFVGGNTSNLCFNRTTTTSIPDTIPSCELNTLTINHNDGVVCGGNVIVNGNTNIVNGLCNVRNNIITLKKPIHGSTGNLRCDSTSSIILACSDTIFPLPSNIIKLKRLDISCDKGVKLNAPITVKDSICTIKGTLDNSGGNSVNMGTKCKFVQSGGSISTSPSYSGKIEICYTATNGNITCGKEVPTNCRVHKVRVKNGCSATLNSNLIICDTLELESGNLILGNKTCTIKGHIKWTNGNFTGCSDSRLIIDSTGANINIPACTLKCFHVKRPNGCTLVGDMECKDTFRMEKGTINLGSQHCKIHGKIVCTGGSWTGSNDCKVTIDDPDGNADSTKVPCGTSHGSPFTCGEFHCDRKKGCWIKGYMKCHSQCELKTGHCKVDDAGCELCLDDKCTITRCEGDFDGIPCFPSNGSNQCVNVAYNCKKTTTCGNEVPRGSGAFVCSLSAKPNGNKDTVVLNTPVTVRDSLVLRGADIDTKGNKLTVGTSATNPGTVIRTEGSIIGCLNRWFPAATSTNPYIYPIKQGNRDVPGDVSYTSAPTTGGQLMLCFREKYPTKNGLPLTDGTLRITDPAPAGYWIQTINGIVGGVYTVNLTGGDFQVGNYVNCRILKRFDSLSPWMATGTPGTPAGSNASPMLQRIGISTATMQYAFAGPAVASLPVQLISFKGRKLLNDVSLLWVTASEYNNQRFDVERSEDGVKWEYISSVTGFGTTQKISNYHFNDQNVFFGNETRTIYYRLKQVDYNGHYEYSDMISIKNTDGDADARFSVFPNPSTNDNLTISYKNMPINGIFQLRIFNQMGYEVMEKNVTIDHMNGELNVTSLTGNRLAPGVYMMNISGAGNTYNEKIIIQ